VLPPSVTPTPTPAWSSVPVRTSNEPRTAPTPIPIPTRRPPEPTATRTPPIKLELDWQAGENGRLQWRVTEAVYDGETSLPVLSMRANADFLVSVGEVDQDGTATVSFTYDRIYWEREPPLHAYSSWDPRGNPPGEIRPDGTRGEPSSPVGVGLTSLLGRSFSALIASNGEILDIVSADDILREAIDSAGKREAGYEQPFVPIMRSLAGEAWAIEMIHFAVGEFPERPVPTGDSWVIVSGTLEGAPLQREQTTHVFGELDENNRATVLTEASIRLDSNRYQQSIEPTLGHETLHGIEFGSYALDTNTGWPTLALAEIRSPGRIPALNGGTEQTEAEPPIEFVINIEAFWSRSEAE